MRMEPRRNHLKSVAKKDVPTESRPEGSAFDTVPTQQTERPLFSKPARTKDAPKSDGAREVSAGGTHQRRNAVMKGVQTSPRKEESAIGMEPRRSVVTKDVRMFP